ncbi:Uncharacterised protein [Raoultella terrigena]|uniref:Uncharacterized protein n=1 Tax=Raoultella terrigena TaxID=577 RepID=A0A485CGZ2_RAOTE|nr:Uncharacterised protein [Raoultella terrigena]
MDTVEELNGTYFYKGIDNISAGELFFWLFLDKTNEQFGGGYRPSGIELHHTGVTTVKDKGQTLWGDSRNLYSL